MDQFLDPETDKKHQFLDPETDKKCQFLDGRPETDVMDQFLDPETDIMGEGNYIPQPIFFNLLNNANLHIVFVHSIILFLDHYFIYQVVILSPLVQV